MIENVIVDVNYDLILKNQPFILKENLIFIGFMHKWQYVEEISYPIQVFYNLAAYSQFYPMINLLFYGIIVPILHICFKVLNLYEFLMIAKELGTRVHYYDCFLLCRVKDLLNLTIMVEL